MSSNKAGERPHKAQKAVEYHNRPSDAFDTVMDIEVKTDINKEARTNPPLPPNMSLIHKPIVKAPKARAKILAYQNKEQYIEEAREKLGRIKDVKYKRKIQDLLKIAENPYTTLQMLQNILIDDAAAETERRKKSLQGQAVPKAQTATGTKTAVGHPGASSSAETGNASVSTQRTILPKLLPKKTQNPHLGGTAGEPAGSSKAIGPTGAMKIPSPSTYNIEKGRGPVKQVGGTSKESTFRNPTTTTNNMRMNSSPGDKSRSTNMTLTITKNSTPSSSKRGVSQMSSSPKATIVKRSGEKDGTRTEVSLPSAPRSENEKKRIQLSPKTQRLSSPVREDRGNLARSDHSERETQSPQRDEYENIFEYDPLTASLEDYNYNGPYDSYMI